MKPEHQRPRILEFAQRNPNAKAHTAKYKKGRDLSAKQPACLKLTSGTGELTKNEVALRRNKEEKNLTLITFVISISWAKESLLTIKEIQSEKVLKRESSSVFGISTYSPFT